MQVAEALNFPIFNRPIASWVLNPQPPSRELGYRRDKAGASLDIESVKVDSGLDLVKDIQGSKNMSGGHMMNKSAKVLARVLEGCVVFCTGSQHRHESMRPGIT